MGRYIDQLFFVLKGVTPAVSKINDASVYYYRDFSGLEVS
jgi:hypothetical protein